MNESTDVSPGKQLLQRQALLGRVWMQRKLNDLHADGEVRLELIHTPGAEVAPRSDVVGEDFQGEFVRQHFAASPGVS